jgi:hypothetical protein
MKLEISKEDQLLLEKFQHGFNIGGTSMGAELDFGELISQKLGEKLEEQREEGLPQNNKNHRGE